MSDNRVEPVLSAQRWRLLRSLLTDTPRDAEPILRREEWLGGEAYVTLCYELHHVLLPELAKEGLVEFDPERNRVERGERFDEVRPFLEHAAAARREATR